MLQEIVDRCVYERDEWLKLAPTGDEEFKRHCFAGVAKQCMNLENYLFQMTNKKQAMQAVADETDRYIGLCSTKMQIELRDTVKENREASSFLPICACCDKYNPDKRHFCGRCMTALYCDVDCQKTHWPVHKLQCGQPACAACGKIPEKPMKCGRCMQVTYCDKAHQKYDWCSHKKECKAKAKA